MALVTRIASSASESGWRVPDAASGLEQQAEYPADALLGLHEHGRSAIEPLAEWTAVRPELGWFAVRALQMIAAANDADEVLVHRALDEARPRIASASVRRDVEELLDVLALDIEWHRMISWMNEQNRPRSGLAWTGADAARLLGKMSRVDARRADRGEPRLTGQERTDATTSQFAGFNATRYLNHCWRCAREIDSQFDARCDACSMFFCSSCDACMCDRQWIGRS